MEKKDVILLGVIAVGVACFVAGYFIADWNIRQNLAGCIIECVPKVVGVA